VALLGGGLPVISSRARARHRIARGAAPQQGVLEAAAGIVGRR
jgi:hypothetical protein